MVGTHVRVRVPSAGTGAGDFIRQHPNARMACIETGREHGPAGPVIHHFALLEGVNDRAVADLLMSWDRLYGIPATLATGTAFAVHLPLPVLKLRPEVVSRMTSFEVSAGHPLGHVLEGEHCDMWIACDTPAAAREVADAARLHLPGGSGAFVAVGEPPVADQECWAALRLADEVVRSAA